MKGQRVRIVTLRDALGAVRCQQETKRRAGIRGGGPARGVDQRRGVPQCRLPPAGLSFGDLGEVESLRHVTDEPHRRQPKVVRLIAQGSRRPPGEQGRGRLRIETVSTDGDGAVRFTGRDVMVDDEGRAAGQDRVRPSAEIGDDQRAGAPGSDPVGDLRIPRRLAFADDEGFSRHTGLPQGLDQDGGRGQAIGIEMADDQDRRTRFEGGEHSRHRFPRSRAHVAV
ncbi:hypothetical protein SAMN05192568_10432 [Methylobacterium pseudosasicola]|uniref:Uncharacterized protein n=1 Tax=Methylobacterium pseudosasicola TaxID=582667 RepID=A0A1I4SKD6_9HYPH|nr:hypothetical protein SAMN05192568_10432 [Methylobacterium pseudosasicola]